MGSLLSRQKGTPSQEELKSLLQKFDTEPSQDFSEFLLVRCPKDDCPSHNKDGTVRPFLVHKRTWMRPLRSKIKPEIRYFTRPCAYCFRVSKMR